ncbi:MAG: hypothetical protein JXA68_04250 [Ignavibacteriales bacterium]|nr:hypothetical protein [Ignavibacteriales bacterium]
MKHLIETLEKKFSGYGHYKISIEIEGKKLSTTTTNMPAIDAAFDDCYDDLDNSDRIYETRKEAQTALVNEIFYANDIKL